MGSMFGKRATAISSYMTKGTAVAVAGSLSTHEHNGKTYVELNVHDVKLMGGRAGGGSTGSGSGGRSERPRDPGPYDAVPPDDSEIPF